MGFLTFVLFWIVLWPVGAFSNYRTHQIDPGAHHEYEDARRCLRLACMGMLSIGIGIAVLALNVSLWWFCIPGFLYV